MIKNKNIIDAIGYILGIKKGLFFSKLKIIKLLFIADKTHLEEYGRTITGDIFKALKMGPIGSKTLDFLNLKFEDEKQEKYFNSIIGKEGSYNFYFKGKNIKNLNSLSESDREIINKTVSVFGNFTENKLIDFLHTFPEWKKHEYDLKQGKRKSCPIPVEDLIGTPVFESITEERIKLCKEIFS